MVKKKKIVQDLKIKTSKVQEELQKEQALDKEVSTCLEMLTFNCKLLYKDRIIEMCEAILQLKNDA